MAVGILFALYRVFVIRKRRENVPKNTNFEPIRERQPDPSSNTIQLQPNTNTNTNSQVNAAASTNTSSQNAHAVGTAGDSVNRNTSVRSIMTLPAYRPKADNNEEVLGREGERGGIDVIVDMPSDEHHEAMRDEEMAAMYQVRELRRQFYAEEQQLTAQRTEASRLNDTVALRQSRARSRANADNTNARLGELREQITSTHQRRERSTSSVSYGELGVARHDGSRIRASSNDSERMGLLSDAASIEGAAAHRRSISAASFASMNSDGQSHNERQNEQPLHPAETNSGDVGVPPPEYQSSTNELNESPVIVSNHASSTDSPPLYTEHSNVSSPDIADQSTVDVSVPEIRIESHVGPSSMHTQTTTN